MVGSVISHPPAAPLLMLLDEHFTLKALASSETLPHSAVREANGLLMAADRVASTDIAEHLQVSRSTVLAWRRDFPEHGIECVGKV